VASNQQSMALHEIRKLNSKVKQTAERLCRRESPEDTDDASPDLVKILKASELMSRQFDVIELLANEELAMLPLNSISEVYKIFDKCARIYRTASMRINLDAPAGYYPRVDVCDKTFPIIPSVLIENALKYSAPASEVRVTFSQDGPHTVTVCVSNVSLLAAPLTDAVFERGYRGPTDTDGSGNGLYVAQLVAKQHGATIRLDTSGIPNGRTRVTFCLSFKVK
jgi:light-regulated signal transduction histidine kinase (bacteriophytochrome)